MGFNLPKIVMVLGGAEGAGFSIDNLGEQALGVLEGTVDAKAIPGQVMAEGIGVLRNLKNDPIGTGMNVAVGVAMPYFVFKGIGTVCKTFGIPTSIMGVTYAIRPKTKRRKKKKKTTTRKVYVSRSTGRRVKKPKTRKVK